MYNSKKHRNDMYYRRAKEQGWLTTCAFKLLQIDEMFDIFKGATRAVDLCAAPGSWSQVLSRKLYMGENIVLKDKTCMFYNEIALHHRLGVQEEPQFNKNESVKIVAVDLQPMSYLPGVTQIQGDITQISVAQEIIRLFEVDFADLVVFDGVSDETYLISMNIYLQSKLLLAALHIACNVLGSGGTFVAKIFKEYDHNLLKNQLLALFEEVHDAKPSSSKDSDIESFLVCQNYSPPEGFDPKLMTQFIDSSNKNFSGLNGINRLIIPFIICGDLSAFDSDISNSLQIENKEVYKYKPPLLLPTNVTACSSTNLLTKEDFEDYLKNIDGEVKQDNLDHEDRQCQQTKVSASEGSRSEEKESKFGEDGIGAMKNNLDNGPYFDLLEKTKRLKNQTTSKLERETVEIESGLQFLYEDEDTDPELIRECIERMKISNEQSTCNCTFFE